MLEDSWRDTVLWISDTEYSGPSKSLQIRGFTPEFDYSQRNSLFYSFGATSVHNFPYYSVAFFATQDECFRVISELHQRILFTTSEPEINKNCSGRLKVEFVKKIVPFGSNEVLSIPLLRPINSNYLHTSRRTATNKTSPGKFVFPDASSKVVKRICDIIMNDKAFYYDVLLLMIQHNLKPPFDDASVNDDNISNDPNKEDNDCGDDIPAPYKQYYKLFKTKQPQTKRPNLKTGFLGDELPPKRSKSEPDKVEMNKIFDKTDLKLRKHQIILDIPLPPKMPSTSSSSVNDSSSNDNEFGTLTFAETSKTDNNAKKVPVSNFDLNSLSSNEILTESSLTANRISRQEWPIYSVFGNYTIGEPSQSLYIKNLNSRKVVLKDLYRIFAGFIDLSDQSQKDSFDIILMKSGRLRGQAFVSFPSIELARKALQITNGYLLHHKPMVVSFSRNNKK